MAALTLSIAALGEEAGWRANWLLDGQALGAPLPIAGSTARGLGDLSARFLDLFKHNGRPLTDPQYFACFQKPRMETAG